MRGKIDLTLSDPVLTRARATCAETRSTEPGVRSRRWPRQHMYAKGSNNKEHKKPTLVFDRMGREVASMRRHTLVRRARRRSKSRRMGSPKGPMRPSARLTKRMHEEAFRYWQSSLRLHPTWAPPLASEDTPRIGLSIASCAEGAAPCPDWSHEELCLSDTCWRFQFVDLRARHVAAQGAEPWPRASVRGCMSHSNTRQDGLLSNDPTFARRQDRAYVIYFQAPGQFVLRAQRHSCSR